MSEHQVQIRTIERLTPDVRRYVCDKPDGYDFTPGQATDVAVLRDGWRDEERPFTFTSLPDADTLEFTIKTYPSHDGVTEQIGDLEEGDTLRIGDPWGAITDQGPGTFIAGGAGVTPFLPILRRRAADQSLEGCHLIFSNDTEDDIILRDELEGMTSLRTTFLVTDQPDSDLASGRLDKQALADLVDPDDRFYLCGPPEMVDDLQQSLKALGTPEDRIVTEDLG